MEGTLARLYRRRQAVSALLFFACATIARANDFGPRGDISEVRFDAQRLLAHRVRTGNVDPRAIVISDVVVVKNAAILSWGTSPGRQPNVMGLIRIGSRWWDAFDGNVSRTCWDGETSYPLAAHEFMRNSVFSQRDLAEAGMPRDLVAASTYNKNVAYQAAPPTPAAYRDHGKAFVLVKPGCDWAMYAISLTELLKSAGGSFSVPRQDTSGYDIQIHYAVNDAQGAVLQQPYARPPTQAEFLPYPTTLNFLETAVLYFDFSIQGSKPVAFQPGTTIDIWFPFVLDDALRYDLTIAYADNPIGPVYAKPFDNVLRFTLPAFTATPGRTLMGEVDGDWH